MCADTGLAGSSGLCVEKRLILKMIVLISFSR